MHPRRWLLLFIGYWEHCLTTLKVWMMDERYLLHDSVFQGSLFQIHPKYLSVAFVETTCNFSHCPSSEKVSHRIPSASGEATLLAWRSERRHSRSIASYRATRRKRITYLNEGSKRARSELDLALSCHAGLAPLTRFHPSSTSDRIHTLDQL